MPLANPNNVSTTKDHFHKNESNLKIATDPRILTYYTSVG